MNDGFIYGDQIFVIIGLSLLSFWMIRWYLWGIKTYPLNNSAQKKRKRAKPFGSGSCIQGTGRKFLNFSWACIL